MKGRVLLAAVAGLAAMSAGAVAAVQKSASSPMDMIGVGSSSTGSGSRNGGRRNGNRAYQRAALKKRNRARHRKACRG